MHHTHHLQCAVLVHVSQQKEKVSNDVHVSNNSRAATLAATLPDDLAALPDEQTRALCRCVAAMEETFPRQAMKMLLSILERPDSLSYRLLRAMMTGEQGAPACVGPPQPGLKDPQLLKSLTSVAENPKGMAFTLLMAFLTGQERA